MNILITGASGGIGLALTRQYLAEGHVVLATWRDAARAEPLLALSARHAGQLHPLRLDVTGSDAPSRLAEAAARHVPELDLLIHAAGLFPAGERIGRLTAASLAEAYAANAIAPLVLTQALLPRLFASRRPRVVNLTSDLAGAASPDCPGAYAYAASKAALNRLTQLLAQELAPAGIVVAAINPGWTRSRMGGNQAPRAPDETAERLMAVIDGLGQEDSGQILSCWHRPPSPRH